MIIRVARRTGSAEMQPASSSPSIPGIRWSRIAIWYGCPADAAARSRSSAVGASNTASGSMSHAVSWLTRISRLVALSSTTSTRMPASEVETDGGELRRTPGTEANGKANQNRLPIPASLSTPIRPPMPSTSRCEMARPRPEPP